jgi:outer membrane protein assembly factor BamD
LLGRESKTVQVKEQTNGETEQRSLTNRLSLGLLDKPTTEEIDSAPIEEPTDKPSWMNRLSFGLLDKPETKETSGADAAN